MIYRWQIRICSRGKWGELQIWASKQITKTTNNIRECLYSLISKGTVIACLGFCCFQAIKRVKLVEMSQVLLCKFHHLCRKPIEWVSSPSCTLVHIQQINTTTTALKITLTNEVVCCFLSCVYIKNGWYRDTPKWQLVMRNSYGKACHIHILELV